MRKIKIDRNTYDWWGPPKQFSTEVEERKISWLELFYDLVYVIAISRITHHLAEHPDVSGLLDYVYFFVMIFWGWLNGSLYYDLHGNDGLRTRLMTLWQIMIVAALVVTLNSAPESVVFNATIMLMVMQLYITYLWWSVGIYDKAHRQLNKPYTVLYLISFALMFISLYSEPKYLRYIFYISLIINYLPPFIGSFLLKRNNLDFSLSPSMTERLGLFTIIIFGEVVLGVVNGVSALKTLSPVIWLNFGMAILIVFSLWWLFFVLISDRKCKKGFLISSLMELVYIPTLMSLGMMGAAFNGLFEASVHSDAHNNLLRIVFGLALSLFILGMYILLYFLEFDSAYIAFKKSIQSILLMASIAIALFISLGLELSLTTYFLVILSLILTLILAMNINYYRFLTKLNNADQRQIS